eukprot:SAG22_NODE_3521_length_1664_cov_2.835783_2_plen_234_part_00
MWSGAGLAAHATHGLRGRPHLSQSQSQSLNGIVHGVVLLCGAALRERRSLLLAKVAELDTLPDPTEAEFSQLRASHERLAEIGADSAVGRATALLKNLGFSAALLGRPVKDLSGGWRVRVALAQALFAAPDLLLLDEPTNHLSIEAVLWLQHELNTNPVWQSRIVISVSHDRAFLDDVCTDSLHISGAARRLTQERGNYSAWAKRRAAKKKAWDTRSRKRTDAMDHLREFINR